jgi:hypothetical protein
MKLTPGIKFINVLHAAFMREDPECKKRQSSQQSCLVLSRSTSIKAAHKTLMKSTPETKVIFGVNFINIFCAFFS